MKKRALVAFVLCMSLFAPAAFAQQTGSISGKVTMADGSPLPGVTVEASSNVLPTPRVAVTEANGEFRMPALQPGTYTVTFSMQGMRTVRRPALVQLSQDTAITTEMSVEGLTEEVTVRAEASFIDRGSAEIKVGLSNQQIQSLPAGQEYRDLIKLIPGIMFTQDAVRGPSAGGSGQDNVYNFDGANVTLPLFGTLASEPASHDIAQVTTIKGGARAVGFDRAGGFSIDSVSKSGTNRFTGMASFQLLQPEMVSDLKVGQTSRYEQSRTWINLNAGGPVIPNKLFFYGSYYRPERKRDNAANAYGDLPDYTSTRNEGFGKLTWQPLSGLLLNGSYRDSKRVDKGDTFGGFSRPSIGESVENRQRIAAIEGSWIINQRNHLTFKASHFGLESLAAPINVAGVTPNEAIGTMLNVAALDQQGLLTVPQILANQPAYNAFVQPIVDQYGYLNANGVRTGGGLVGVASQFNDQDFFRRNVQVGYNITFGSTLTHDVHVGYQRFTDREELRRRSNGWGSISVPGGRLAAIPGTGQSAFYTARIQRLTAGVLPVINSEYESHNVEINDTIRWGNWTFNAGLLTSYDILYGQGLKEDSSTPSGFVTAPLNKYTMHTLGFDEMLQPRVSTTWAYNGRDTVYGSFARYIPAASSLPRAASWDRGLTGLFVDAHFDATGKLFATVPVSSSTGKIFADDLTPRRTDEYTIGTSKQLNDRLSVRAYGRYRESKHFWEDTQNGARSAAFGAPADLIAKGLYIPDLAAKLAPLGVTATANTYVIAELDGAYTDYREATIETEYRGAKTFVRGSYTWSRYYGNIDQDNSSTGNDAAIFIGSSNIADGAGRQLWDNKEGILRGDRPHAAKLLATYMLPWRGEAGLFVVAQSGQPWEEWSYEPYTSLIGTNTSDLIRYAEPAGSRRTNPHWQMDLKYTQDVPIGGRYRLQLVADLYNVTDSQTGYNVQPAVHSAGFGVPRNWYDPRRLELAARFQF